MSEGRTQTQTVVEAYWAALRSGDFATVDKLYADDLTYHYVGKNPISGTHVGKAACFAVLGQINKKTRRKIVEVTDTAYSDCRAVVMAKESFERAGKQKILDRVFIYRIEAGKIAEAWIFDHDQKAVDWFFAD